MTAGLIFAGELSGHLHHRTVEKTDSFDFQPSSFPPLSSGGLEGTAGDPSGNNNGDNPPPDPNHKTSANAPPPPVVLLSEKLRQASSCTVGSIHDVGSGTQQQSAKEATSKAKK